MYVKKIYNFKMKNDYISNKGFQLIETYLNSFVQPSLDEYMYNLCNEFLYSPINESILKKLQFELDKIENVYGKKFVFNICNDKISIKMTRPLLIYLDEELDNNKEYELLSDNEYGFDVKIIYGINSYHQEKEQYIHNVTEVHYLYKSFNGDRVAIESDIHSTGFNEYLKDIISIEINYSTKLYKDLFL